jgi:hypothetical protein
MTAESQFPTDSGEQEPVLTTMAGDLPLLFNEPTIFDFWDTNSVFSDSFPVWVFCYVTFTPIC